MAAGRGIGNEAGTLNGPNRVSAANSIEAGSEMALSLFFQRGGTIISFSIDGIRWRLKSCGGGLLLDR
jgi:hypothetical protein